MSSLLQVFDTRPPRINRASGLPASCCQADGRELPSGLRQPLPSLNAPAGSGLAPRIATRSEAARATTTTHEQRRRKTDRVPLSRGETLKLELHRVWEKVRASFGRELGYRQDQSIG